MGSGDLEIRRISELETLTDARGLSNYAAVLKTVHGNIVIKFYPQDAPNTVKRIIDLINEGFYDGLPFHKVVSDFVIQTGDPTGTGTGGSNQKLKAEFSQLKHVRGTVAMARANNPDSADSQFYICLARLESLDNQYTVFGKVVKGIEFVKKIQPNDIMKKVFIK